MGMTKLTPDRNENEILDRINWRPGHMIKAIKDIKSTIQRVDIIVEVRDARVPMVSGNKDIYNSGGKKPYLIVFNKTNLADPEAVELWKTWLTKQKESYVFINALDNKSIKMIVRRTKEILQNHHIKTNSTASAKKEVSMMILGLPNTGKSTIINKLSGRNATKAAATPGQTKLKLWVKVDKELSILDTPGVMPPIIHEQVHAMWLSVIHAIPDHIITPEYSACYIVEYLLRMRSSAIHDLYKIEAEKKELIEILDHIGKRRGCLAPGGGFDYDHVYKIILADFRKGALGLISFERPPK
jgi:ribosome biogenesis GTPase A